MLLDSTKLTLETTPPGGQEEELIDLITGEVIQSDDADALITSFERIKAQADKFYAQEKRIRLAIGRLTEGEAKTRRIRGKLRAAKVEMPDDYWSQPILKEAWYSYPALRDEFLRIDAVAVKLREWKKLKETSGEPNLETFKKMLTSANLGAAGGTPRVTVEK